MGVRSNTRQKEKKREAEVGMDPEKRRPMRQNHLGF